ncbi:SurA N-terminal domain-containing protein [Phytoactinopolyspora halophila]|uniref:SurA N-terminal domain-containing protein n=1 Tax=Phytoactinopolyspora halophila TaxID=1981511 RepID=UPI0013DE2FD9|nr:SurA N-terminal domain-containing protein [Phytoactinopolyspora halophila]
MSNSRWSRQSCRFLVVPAVAAVVAALAACDPAQVGAAATVDGERLSVSGLQEQVDEVIEVRNAAIEEHDLPLQPLGAGDDTAEIQQELLSRWVINRLYEDLAAESGIEITEADVDDFLEQFAEQFPDGDMTAFLAEQSFTEELLRTEARTALISQEITSAEGGQQAAQEMLQSAVAEKDIEINPRYGEWTAEQGFVPESGSVSKPFEEEPAGENELPVEQ